MNEDGSRLTTPVYRFVDLTPEELRRIRSQCTWLGSIATALSTAVGALILTCGYGVPSATVATQILTVGLGTVATVMCLLSALTLLTGGRNVRTGRFNAGEAAQARQVTVAYWMMTLLTSTVSALSFHSAVRVDGIAYGHHLEYTAPVMAYLMLLISPLLVATATTVAAHQVLRAPTSVGTR
ncbi:hypothetical protein QFW96_08040 [Saccharopolyspora sp. TS4A08]|uniref:DUF2975 domain-containing protein n=1 Tax=Saccharopolyspora ipomoeae TaxID=3042027 RepID=A0ABT6PKR1_9PSEU|nr:hypothetical protein [Saccharopolyspora sp. TS4A08]MDI2028558.1 hypothetical protein [Saccharopolyspora sp. TS4A08]